MIYLIKNGTSLEEQILAVRERLLRHREKPVNSGDTVIIQNVAKEIIELVNLPGDFICNKGKWLIQNAKEIYFIKSEIKRQADRGVTVVLQTPRYTANLF